MDTHPTTPQPPATGSRRINVGEEERLASVAGGAVLTYLGLKRFSKGGLLLAAAGGALLYRGLTGHCPVNAAIGRDTSEAADAKALEIETTLSVDRPREEVYGSWRQLEQLPRFMRHIAQVRPLDDRRSHWTARAPRGAAKLEWTAEITEDRPSERLAWRSEPGSEVDNAGEVDFRDAPGGRGTEVHVRITYRPPAGELGRQVGRLLDPAFEGMIREDIRRFKQVVEAGEIPTIEGQPTGAR